MIFSKCGRKLRVGQLVDIPVSGMMTCQVMQVEDSPIALPGGQQVPPRLIVQPVPLQMQIGRNQANNLVAPEVYVVHDAPPESKKDKQDMQDNDAGDGVKKGLTLVS